MALCTATHKDASPSFPDKDVNFNTKAGPVDEIHWVETDVTRVGAQVVFHHRTFVDIPWEYLCGWDRTI